MSQTEAAGPAWIEADWPAPPRVRALATLRGGGVSSGRYASLNLGDHVGDLVAAVGVNRERLGVAAALPANPRWLRQVHGTAVADLDLDGAGAAPPVADAAMTRTAGLICTILTADCVPVLFACDRGEAVAAAHAGWRGLAAGVLPATLAAVGLAPARVLAWIGPCIGPDHYEVGAEVREGLLASSPGAARAFTANARGRWHADLALLVRLQLESLGLTRIYAAGLCTHAEPERFFSHRRDGETGRQASLIWLEPPPGG